MSIPWSLEVLLHVVGFMHVIHACRRVRTSQGASGWSLFLIVLPAFAIPAYWLFGPWRFHDFEKIIEREYKTARDEDGMVDLSEVLHYEEPHLQQFFQICDTISPLRATCGNSLELRTDRRYFDELRDLIRGAERFVLLQFFIFRSDKIGGEIVKLLEEASCRGVRVVILVDEFGSRGLARSAEKRLAKCGAQVARFITTSGSVLNRLRLNSCNHRKLVVVDGKTALCGGINIGDEYLGRHERFSHWRDTAVLIRGPLVRELTRGFLIDWRCSTTERLIWLRAELGNLTFDLCDSIENSGVALSVYTSPVEDDESGTLFLISAIESAQQRLWISTPYYVPPLAVMIALTRAVKRGVNVKILIPDTADIYALYLANLFHAHRSLELNIPIYRYTKGFVHQKVLLADSAWAAVGSLNIDHRSLYWNFENMIVSPSPDFVRDVEEMLSEDFKHSYRQELDLFEKASFITKTASQLSRLAAPLL